MNAITGALFRCAGARCAWPSFALAVLLITSSALPVAAVVTGADPLAASPLEAQPSEYDVLYIATRGDKITFLGERFDESIIRTSSTGEAAPESSPSDNGDVWKMASEPAPYGGGCCEPPSCGCPTSCCPATCCPPPCCVPTYWLGGVEATFLAADINDGSVGYQLADNFASPVVDQRVASPDLDNFYIAPQLLARRATWLLGSASALLALTRSRRSVRSLHFVKRFLRWHPELRIRRLQPTGNVHRRCGRNL